MSEKVFCLSFSFQYIILMSSYRIAGLVVIGVIYLLAVCAMLIHANLHYVLC